jgi:type I restriction enzyme S subunit
LSRVRRSLPSGWEEVQLGKVAQLSGRIGWKGLTAKEYTKEGPLFLSVHSLNYGDYVDFRDAFHISRERYDESPEIMLRPKDVLICKDGAGIGKLGIVDNLPGDTTINSSLLLVRARERILPKYLYYILSSPYFQSIVRSRLMGATTPHLYQRDIAEFPIYLPPLLEQQQIVATLDEAFIGLATVIANARNNLKNAKDLFESYFNSTFRREEGCEETTLGTIAEFKNGLNFTRSSKGEKICIVGVKDFQNNFWIPTEDLEVAQIDGRLSEAYLLQKNDILTVRSNGNRQLIGRCILAADDLPEKASHSGFTIRIRIRRVDVSPAYLVRYLKSNSVRKVLIESGDGAQISNLNQQTLATLPIKLPDLKRQMNVVEHLSEFEAETDRLQKRYEQRIKDLTELKESVLQNAFNGKLALPRVNAIGEAAE